MKTEILKADNITALSEKLRGYYETLSEKERGSELVCILVLVNEQASTDPYAKIDERNKFLKNWNRLYGKKEDH